MLKAEKGVAVAVLQTFVLQGDKYRIMYCSPAVRLLSPRI